MPNGSCIHCGAFDIDDLHQCERALSVAPLVRRPRPEESGVGEWCAPGPSDKQKRQWLLIFEDKDMGQSLFENETEAREAFARAEGGGWNCHLFAHAPRSPSNDQS